MLFELLTGRQPYTGDTPLAVAYRHVNEVVPAPSSLVPGLPPALDSLVALATSKEPGPAPGRRRAVPACHHRRPARPATGRPAARALRRAAPGCHAQAVPPGFAPDASRADTAPPRAVVAPVWPGPPPADWPAQPSAPPGAQSGPPSGGWPRCRAAGWPGPAAERQRRGHDPRHADGDGGAVLRRRGRQPGALPDPYRPATNQTLIVSAVRRSVRGRLRGRATGIRGCSGCCSAAGSPTSRPVSRCCWCSACSAGGCSRAGTRSCPRSPGSPWRRPSRPAQRRASRPGATTTVLDNSVAKGLVIRTSPANGSRIARGGRSASSSRPART